MRQDTKDKLRDIGYKGKFTFQALVEACGDRFFELTWYKKEKNPNAYGWVANAEILKPRVSDWFKQGRGKTKEDAMGELLLSLEEKK